MHPNPAYRSEDRGLMEALIAGMPPPPTGAP